MVMITIQKNAKNPNHFVEMVYILLKTADERKDFVSLFLQKRKSMCKAHGFYGAGDEARTRYLHLGKVALYRMSYTRRNKMYYSGFSQNVKGYFRFRQIFLFLFLRAGSPGVC